MKTTTIVCFSSLFLLGLITACSKSNGDDSKTCDFQLVDSETLTSTTSVIYLAGVSGAGGHINSVTYLDANGSQTVEHPVLPWQKTVTLNQGAKASISAKGTANKDGQINISFVIAGAQEGTTCTN